MFTSPYLGSFEPIAPELATIFRNLRRRWARSVRRDALVLAMATGDDDTAKPSPSDRLAASTAISSVGELFPLLVVMATKGGVNKSLGCLTLRDALEVLGIPTLVIDSDRANPDVHLAVQSSHGDGKSVCIDTNSEAGLEAVTRLIEKVSDKALLMSRPAGTVDEFLAWADIFEAVASTVNRRIVVLWPLDRSDDSFLHLEAAMAKMPSAEFWVARAEFFGAPSAFTAFNVSPLASELNGLGRVLNLPKMPGRAFDAFKGSSRKTPAKYAADGGLTEQAIIQSWRLKVRSELGTFIREYFPHAPR